MAKGVFRVIFFTLYFLAAGVISHFIPDEIRFAIGFLFGIGSLLAWKVIARDTRPIGEFIGCTCPPERRSGETSVMCCNLCGKPTEEFWTGEDPERDRRRYVREHREFLRVNNASRELQSLKEWWSRLQLDLVSDDYSETARIIQDKVLKLREQYPAVVTVDECAFFNIFCAVGEEGKEERHA